VTGDGYFTGSAHAPIILGQGLRAFDIAQLAPARNRPDKVLEALGAPAEQISFFHTLWLRRLKRLGLESEAVDASFTAAPTARILSTEVPDPAGRTRVQVAFGDGQGLVGYQVYVNGVPIAARQRTTTSG